ncbi:hypothetical protein MZ16F92_40750 [Escherichia coli]
MLPITIRILGKYKMLLFSSSINDSTKKNDDNPQNIGPCSDLKIPIRHIINIAIETIDSVITAVLLTLLSRLAKYPHATPKVKSKIILFVAIER